jgi:hypothetical protein
MSHTVSVRLPPELAEWLENIATRTGVPQSKIIRDQLELARSKKEKPFRDLIGCMSGPPDLSSRKGFSPK